MALENHFPAGTGLCDTSALAELRSYVHVKKIPRGDFNDKRTFRSPVAGRLNYVGKIDMTTSVSYPGYLNVSIPCTTSDDGTIVTVTTGVSSNAFQLPPLPYASSLQLHSIFSDTVTTPPAQWATSRLLSLQNITPRIEIKSRTQEPSALPLTPAAVETRLRESSPVMHPNNPYVPWTSEMRREYLRPLPSYSPCVNCNASKCSRTVLQSEPVAISAGHRSSEALSKRTKLSAGLKTLASTISKNFKQVTKRMSRYKGPTRTLNTSEPAIFSYILSSNSFESMDATTLSAWLSDRQNKQSEYEKTFTKEMTLDEYEERGSWTHLPRSALMNVARFPLLNGSLSPRKSRSESILKHWSQPVSLVARSPRVESSCLNECDIGGILSTGNREMSMPGGWIFG